MMRTEPWVKRDDESVMVAVARINEDNVEEAAIWCGGELIEEIDPEHPEEMQYGINVMTVDGIKRVSLGMYLGTYAKKWFVSHTRPFEMDYKPRFGPDVQPDSAGEAARGRGFRQSFVREI